MENVIIALIISTASVVVAIISVIVAIFANRKSDNANGIAQKSNELSKEANMKFDGARDSKKSPQNSRAATSKSVLC